MFWGNLFVSDWESHLQRPARYQLAPGSGRIVTLDQSWNQTLEIDFAGNPVSET